MQIRQATSRVSQGLVLGTGVRTRSRVSYKGRGADSAAPSLCATAFLTTMIEPIRQTDDSVASRFGIVLDKSYSRIESCCKRFLKFVGISYDYRPKDGLSKSQLISELINYFEKKIEPLGLSLVVIKKGSCDDKADVLESIVYRWGRELEYTIVVLYVAPALYLSPEGSQMYKRFMKYVSDYTNIPLGIKENSDNFYLDSIVNMYDSEDFVCYDDEKIDEKKRGEKVTDKYKKFGEFWNLFDELNGLPKEKPEDLEQDLEAYRKVCPKDELDLVEAMIEGVPILKDCNYYWFDFNPDDDGMPDDNGNTGCDGYSSTVLASAILFSENDGVADALLNIVNDEVNAGITMTGWNIHQYLSPNMKKADIEDFLRCKDVVASLDEWLRVFGRESSKFDMYVKS